MTSPTDYDTSSHPPFAVTVDVALFTIRDGRLCVVLVQRANEPFKGALALPGGFVDADEDLPTAAARELAEETGLEAPAHLLQLGAYGAPGRDPRMRVVTVVYWALTDDLPEPRGDSDAASAELVPVDDILTEPDRLAFDHHEILTDAVEQVRAGPGGSG